MALLKTFFKHDLQTDHALACHYVIREKLQTDQHLTVQTCGN
jgi:hypothetical protein